MPSIQVSIDPSYATHGIEVLSPESQGFDSHLEGLLPDPSVLQDVREARSFGVILRNNGRKRIAAVGIVLELTSQAGRRVPQHFLFKNLDEVNGLSDLEPGARGRFFSPFMSVNALTQRIVNRSAQLASARSELESRASFLREQRAVHVKVDSVVFTDGRIVGPDTLGAERQINAWLSAENDIYHGILARMDANGTAKDILAWLKSLSAVEVQGRYEDGSRDYYTERRNSVALGASAYIQSHGLNRAAFENTVRPGPYGRIFRVTRE